MVRFRFAGLFCLLALGSGSFVTADDPAHRYVAGRELALETDQQLCSAPGTDNNACVVACGQGYIVCGGLDTGTSCYNPGIGEVSGGYLSH
jgi:hypothetical protein